MLKDQMFSSPFTYETKIKDQKQQQQNPHKTMTVQWQKAGLRFVLFVKLIIRIFFLKIEHIK